MMRLAVSGYASVDYVVGLAGRIEGDHTTLVKDRDPEHWPRIGGCPAYVAIAAARRGASTFPVSWIGSDDLAQIYLGALAEAGVDARGVVQLDRKSPMSILAYQPDGACACLFDPGFTGEERLSDEQRETIASSSHICITVGPPQLVNEILDARQQTSRLYWVCKNDHHAFTPVLRKRLSSEADVIFLSRSERELVGDTKSTVTIIETLGAAGVRITTGGNSKEIPVEPIDVRDTTGAGDTLAGGFIAAEMAGSADPAEAARAGIASVRTLLKERSAKGEA